MKPNYIEVKTPYQNNYSVSILVSVFNLGDFSKSEKEKQNKQMVKDK